MSPALPASRVPMRTGPASEVTLTRERSLPELNVRVLCKVCGPHHLVPQRVPCPHGGCGAVAFRLAHTRLRRAVDQVSHHAASHSCESIRRITVCIPAKTTRSLADLLNLL